MPKDKVFVGNINAYTPVAELHKMYSAVATGLEKVSFHSNHKGNAKECSNYHTIALISYASKVILKILQARFQQYMNHELPEVQAGFRKGRGTRDQIANICWINKKAREFHKNIYSVLLTMSKPLTVWITVCCDPQSQRLWHRQESRSRCFFWNSLAFSMIQWMLAI